MTAACVICQRNPPEDGWTVCRHDLNRIDDDLARILELTRLAADALTPETRAGNGGRSVPGSKPPLDICALDAALGLDAWPVLESWQRAIIEDNGLSPYGAATEARGATLVGTVAFLRSWLLWCAEAPAFAIEELAREVREQRQYLERFDPWCDNGGDKTRLRCPADHPEADGRTCGYTLLIDPERPRDDVVCKRCGTAWTSERLVLVALATPGDPIWMPAQPICDWLKIGSVTLNKWVRDGHVSKRGTLYNVQQAIGFRRA